MGRALAKPITLQTTRMGVVALNPSYELRLLRNRHRHAGDLHLEHAETRARAKIERLPVVAAEGHVGRVGKAVHDAAKLLAARVKDVEPARAAAIDVAGAIDLHAVGNARLCSAQVRENPIGLA